MLGLVSPARPFRMQKIERAPQSERNLETQFPERPTERTPRRGAHPLSAVSPIQHRSPNFERGFNDAHPCVPLSTLSTDHLPFLCCSFRRASDFKTAYPSRLPLSAEIRRARSEAPISLSRQWRNLPLVATKSIPSLAVANQASIVYSDMESDGRCTGQKW